MNLDLPQLNKKFAKIITKFNISTTKTASTHGNKQIDHIIGSNNLIQKIEI